MILRDLTGQRFGRLVVIERAANCGRNVCWLCQCDCGNESTVSGLHLSYGDTKSCGCLQREVIATLFVTHGAARPGRIAPEYRAWQSAKTRTTSPNYKGWHNYGGRGIRVCDEWLDAVKRYVGHSSIAMTADVYGHAEPGAAVAAAVVERLQG